MISSWEPKDYTELINYDPLSIEAPPEELAEELAKIAELEKQALELEALLTEGAPSHDL